MQLALLLSLAGLVATLALHSDKFHVMQKAIPRKDFVQQRPSDAEATHDLVFAVKQNNLVELDKLLIERATPGNAQYQQWLNFAQIGEMTSNAPGAQAVIEWLAANDVTVTWTSAHMDYIKATAKISKWEELLNTKFFLYDDLSRHSGSMKEFSTMHRATEYSLPVEMKTHLSAVFNTVQVPPVFKQKYHRATSKPSFKTEVTIQKLRGEPKPDVDNNGNLVTVSFLNDYYQIFTNDGNAAQQQSVFETSTEYFNPNDLAQFQSKYGLPSQECLAPYGYSTDNCDQDDQSDCGEGNLDVQYIMGISQQTSTIYWYVTDNSTTDPFVAWVTDMSDMANPPLANSMSWGSVEQGSTQDVLDAFNTEALKLAAMGVTITVSSGDNGAGEDAEYCNFDSGSGYYNDYWTGAPWTGQGYFPSFPATSPYVTAVGATMGPEAGNPEITCQSQLGGVITSGGGFSTYYPTPSWQKAKVTNYFATLPADQQPTAGYNPNGRAYPDVSMIGVWYQVVIQGHVESIFGTSASSPVFAALISLANAARAAEGKTSLGFLNPTLYMANHTSMFNDITSGYNKCMAYGNVLEPSGATCCESGFYAIAGWDPATGMGSVNYPSLLDMFGIPHDSGSSSDDGLSDGAVAGIVVGSVAGAALIGAAAFFALSGAGASAAGGTAAAGGAAAAATGATGTVIMNPVAAGAKGAVP